MIGMEINTFYKSQKEVALMLCGQVDYYWGNEIKEDKFIENIKRIVNNNKHLIIKDDNYTAIVKLKCGKKRLELVSRLLNVKNLQ